VEVEKTAICGVRMIATTKEGEEVITGKLGAWVVPESPLPLLLSSNSISKVFSGINLDKGELICRNNEEAVVGMRRST